MTAPEPKLILWYIMDFIRVGIQKRWNNVPSETLCCRLVKYVAGEDIQLGAGTAFLPVLL